MPQSSSKRKNEKTIKKIRLSFAVFILLLIILLVNFFLVENKVLLMYEAALAGLAYLINLRLVVNNMELGKSSETTFYFVVHVIVALGVIFVLVADKSSITPTPIQFDQDE